MLINVVLHLLGYEYDTQDGAEAMRNQERRILGKPLEGM